MNDIGGLEMTLIRSKGGPHMTYERGVFCIYNYSLGYFRFGASRWEMLHMGWRCFAAAFKR